MNPFGLQVIVSDDLPKYEDWSGCRSPSRAKRRHRQGHKTRMVLRDQSFVAGSKLLMSRQAMQQLKNRIDSDIYRMITTGENCTHTYVTPSGEVATFTVEKLRESMKTIHDINYNKTPNFDIQIPLKTPWPYSTKTRYPR